MAKKVITVDYDDIVFRFNDEFIQYMNPIIGKNYTVMDCHTFDFEEMYGLSPAEMSVHLETFCHNHRFHGRLKPYPGAHKNLAVLSQEFSLPIVTSRCESLHDITAELAYAHGFTMFDGYHFGNSISRVHTNKRRKSEICPALDAKIHIEDAKHNALDVASVGIPVILMDRPWNQLKAGEEDPAGIYRVGNFEKEDYGWDAVPDLVRSILG